VDGGQWVIQEVKKLPHHVSSSRRDERGMETTELNLGLGFACRCLEAPGGG